MDIYIVTELADALPAFKFRNFGKRDAGGARRRKDEIGSGRGREEGRGWRQSKDGE